MISRKPDSSKKVPTPRLTTSNPEQSLDYVEELLYDSKDPDTTSDLRRPRAASGSDLLADESETSSKTASSKHVFGQPCPDHNEYCHYHHQLTQHCHIPWYECTAALNAIKQSYRARGDWIGAPEGWNKTHSSCLRTDKKCNTHVGLHTMLLEKQRNKKYPEKPRARGKHSRGSGSQSQQEKKKVD